MSRIRCSLRNSLATADQEALNDIGFIWNSRKHMQLQRLEVYRLFKEKTGMTIIPNSFLVPAEEPWPRSISPLNIPIIVVETLVCDVLGSVGAAA